MTILADLAQGLLALLPTYGYAVLGAASVGGAAGLPIPLTLLLLAAGALSADGTLTFPFTVLAACAAAVTGDCIGYWAGRWAGRPLLERAGPRVGLSAPRLAQAERAFGRWGAATVWLTRWLVTAAGPAVNVLAGANRYHFAAFVVFDVAGELLWAAAYIGLGWLFADSWADLVELVDNLAGLVGALVLVAIGGAIAWRLARRPRPAAAVSSTASRLPLSRAARSEGA